MATVGADGGTSQSGKIKFTVVVPVYEQWDLVGDLLSSIDKQDRRLDDVEVLLVDNGSLTVSSPYNMPPNVRTIICKMPGSYAARNMGAAEARGTWLLFTDADCRPDQGWLTALEAAGVGMDETALFAGAVDVVPDRNPNIFEIYDMVRGIPQARYVSRGYGATANLAVSKKQFDRFGGFDAARLSGGDAEFCRRACANGLRLAYVQAALIYHPARCTWRELMTKARRVKGGQLAAGSTKRRLLWSLATLVPPARQSYYLLCNTRHSFSYRLVAIGLQQALWIVEVVEMIRIFIGKRPERR